MKLLSFFSLCSFSTLILVNRFICTNSYKHKDIYRYRSVKRKEYKDKMKYTGFVQDHHCIPKQWKDHNLLHELKYDINSSKNLLIMLNKKGLKHFNVHPDTLLHEGGHVPYNYYVKEQLDYIYSHREMDEKKYLFWLLLHHLKKNMTINKDKIPWK